ncbi:MAG: hypothetical protein M0R73_12435 [Dehalococcoidia bacterium]|nr:hypothetical protein [Dehalococcoidia bacterium]
MEFSIGPAVIELDSRELAAAFWLAVLALVILGWRNTRTPVVSLVKAAALHPVLLTPVAAIAVYTALLAWAGSAVGLWYWGLAKETALWFLGSALVLSMNFTELERHPDYLKQRLRRLIAWSVLVAFLVSLEPLPLAWELLLQPVLAILAIVSVVPARDATQRRVQVIVDVLLALIGVGLLAYSVSEIATGWEQVDKGDILLTLLLPVWMTLGLAPLVYFFAVFFAYDAVRRRVGFSSKSRWVAVRAVVALLSRGVFRPHEIAEFRQSWARQLAQASSFGEARLVVTRHRDSRVQEERERHAEQERRQFAGVQGTNEFGERLDRREFEATHAALRWLSTSHMGWYRRGDRYRPEPFDFFVEKLERDGLSTGDVQRALSKSGDKSRRGTHGRPRPPLEARGRHTGATTGTGGRGVRADRVEPIRHPDRPASSPIPTAVRGGGEWSGRRDLNPRPPVPQVHGRRQGVENTVIP